MRTAGKKRSNAALRLTDADIAKLRPSVRARLGLAEPGSSQAHAAKQRRYSVSWYAPAVNERRIYRDLVPAANKEGAIRQVRARLRTMSFREHKGATNFIANEVKQNPYVAPVRRGEDPEHRLIQQRVPGNAVFATCSCGKWALNQALPMGTSEDQATQYVMRWFEEHRKQMRKRLNTAPQKNATKPATLLALAAQDLRRAKAGAITIPQTKRGALKLTYVPKSNHYHVQTLDGRWKIHGKAAVIKSRLAAMYVEREQNPRVAAKSPSGTTSKKNFLGLGEKARQRRRKKAHRRAKVSAAKARLLDAKAALREARRRNPQAKFSKSTLAYLRTQFAALDNVKIARHRAQLDKVFAQTSRPLLKQLAEAKIEWVSSEAKAALMARRNPAKGKKQNMHPLEIGSHAAIILSGLNEVRRMMTGRKKGSKKKAKKASPRTGSAKSSNKKPNLGLIDVAANLQAAEFLSNALKKKKKKRNATPKAKRTAKANPNNGRIFEEFTGKPSTKITRGFFIPRSEPVNVDQLGTLTEIKLGNLNSGPVLRFPIGVRRANGKFVFSKSLIDERGKAINPKRIHYLPNPSILCAKELGNGRRRFVVAQREPFILPNGEVNKRRNLGVVVQLSYRAPKPHLYDGDTRAHEHFHNLGEEGGRQPQLKVDNGSLRFHGGDYTIREEGIRD